MGRKCVVPFCYTGYRKCKDKVSLYRVPDDDFFLSKWQEAIAREDRPITPKDFVCEKHFKDEDILRRRIIKDVAEQYQRPKLKPDAIPSVFPELPEFILKMVKKRRKMAVKTENHVEEMYKDYNKTELSYENKQIKVESHDMNQHDIIDSARVPVLNNEIHIKSDPEQDDLVKVEKSDEEVDQNIGPKMHQCDECDYKTKYPHNLRTHKTKHLTGEEAYLHCTYCPSYKTKWKLTYRNHLKIKHGIGKQELFKCTLCQFETKVKLCLKRHCDRHRKEYL